MSTGMRYKSKLVNPGEAAGTRGRSAPRPGASLTPHSLFFSLLAAGSCRGHPALADRPRRREAGRWVCGRCSPGPAGSVLSRGAAAVGGVLLPGHSGVSAWGLACWPLFSWIHLGNRRFACFVSMVFGLCFSFFRCLWVCRVGSGGERQRRGWRRHFSMRSTSPIARSSLRSTDAQAQPRKHSPGAWVVWRVSTSPAASIWALGNVCFALQSK